MIRKIAILATFVVLIAGCSRSGKMQRGQQQYQTVQEGSASGVTSTINGPGETPAPVTDTNADTTTNFTLPTNPNPLGNSTAGSVVGSIPSTYPGSAGVPVRRQPRTDTQGMASAPGPVVIDTIGRATPPMPKEMRTNPQSDTDANTTTAMTDTATTTDAQTSTSTSSDSVPMQPAPKKKSDDRNRKPQDQPPPPPPPTDTTGTHG
jgi:hypothetical protein